MYYFGSMIFFITFVLLYVSWIFKKVNFGDEIKKTIKLRYFSSLLGWLAFNIFIPVAAIYTMHNIDYNSPENKFFLRVLMYIFYA